MGKMRKPTSFIHPSAMADVEINQYKFYKFTLPSARVKYLQRPFSVPAVVPVNGLGRYIFIKGVATQFTT
jgi:hypothetical protein